VRDEALGQIAAQKTRGAGNQDLHRRALPPMRSFSPEKRIFM